MTEFHEEVEKIYLQEDYLFTNTNAVITEICKLEESDPAIKHGTHVMKFNKHIFHPQGGGQPSDIGSVEVNSVGDEKMLSFLVKFVTYSPSDREVLLHYGSFEDASMESDFQVGLVVNLNVVQKSAQTQRQLVVVKPRQGSVAGVQLIPVLGPI